MASSCCRIRIRLICSSLSTIGLSLPSTMMLCTPGQALIRRQCARMSQTNTNTRPGNISRSLKSTGLLCDTSLEPLAKRGRNKPTAALLEILGRRVLGAVPCGRRTRPASRRGRSRRGTGRPCARTRRRSRGRAARSRWWMGGRARRGLMLSWPRAQRSVPDVIHLAVIPRRGAFHAVYPRRSECF